MHRDEQVQLFITPSQNISTRPCHRCGSTDGNCDRAKHELAALRSLENARRIAFEAQELERWDGLS